MTNPRSFAILDRTHAIAYQKAFPSSSVGCNFLCWFFFKRIKKEYHFCAKLLRLRLKKYRSIIFSFSISDFVRKNLEFFPAPQPNNGVAKASVFAHLGPSCFVFSIFRFRSDFWGRCSNTVGFFWNCKSLLYNNSAPFPISVPPSLLKHFIKLTSQWPPHQACCV